MLSKSEVGVHPTTPEHHHDAEMAILAQVVTATAEPAALQQSTTEIQEPVRLSRGKLILVTCLVMMCNLTQVSSRVQ